MNDFEKILSKIPEINKKVNGFIEMMLEFRRINSLKDISQFSKNLIYNKLNNEYDSAIKQDIILAEEYDKMKQQANYRDYFFIQFDWDFEEPYHAVFFYQDSNNYYLSLYSNYVFGKDKTLKDFIYENDQAVFNEMVIFFQCKVAHEFLHFYQTILTPERWEKLDTTAIKKSQKYYSHPIEIEAHSYEFALELILKNKADEFSQIYKNPSNYSDNFKVLEKYVENFEKFPRKRKLNKFLNMTKIILEKLN
jgi:hypothetical protein